MIGDQALLKNSGDLSKLIYHLYGGIAAGMAWLVENCEDGVQQGARNPVQI